MVYCSGALGLDPTTGKFVEGDAAARAVCKAIAIEHSSAGLIRHMQTQALSNLGAVLEAAGTSLNKAVKITIFLSSMDHYPKLNEAYAKFFTEDPKPVSARNFVS